MGLNCKQQVPFVLHLLLALLCCVKAAPDAATVCSSLLCVTVSVTPAATLVSNLSFSLSLAGLGGGDGAGFTPNLLAPLASRGVLSRTRIVTADGVEHTPGGGIVGPVSPDGSSVAITGIALGSVAVEDWTLSVVGAELQWGVSRTYTRAGAAAADAFPSLVWQTTTGAYEGLPSASAAAPPSWTQSVQMPSFITSDALLNVSGLAFLDPSGKTAALLCDASRSELALLLSPSGVSAVVHIASAGATAPPCRIGVVKDAAHIVQQLGFGAECALGTISTAGVPFAAHELRHGTLTLVLSEGAQGLGLFSLHGVRDAPLAAFMSRFAQVYNMFSGWMYGNSPASETCIHEVSLFPQLQGIYSIMPPPGQHISVHAAVAQHLDFIFATSITPEGFVAARWSDVGGNQFPDGGGASFPCLIDQQPHLLLAAYYHIVNTGDIAALKRWMPKLDSVMGYMASTMRLDATALLTNALPRCNGVANQSAAGNWLDDIRFGFHDAIVGAYAVEAVLRLGELKAFVGDAAGADALRTLHGRMVAAYNTEYWDAATGLYHDWADASGRKRSYAYLWQQYLAIEFGIADAANRTSTLLAAIDAKYAAAAAAAGVPRTALWCAPTNLEPVAPLDITTDFDDEFVWPHYENGACFHWQLGIEILALGRAAGSNAAYERFRGVLPEWERSRLWGQRYDWVAQTPLGLDVITDALFVLYGGLASSFGVRATLSGIERIHAPAAALEGSNWTFAHLGKDVTVAVVHGAVVVLPIVANAALAPPPPPPAAAGVGPPACRDRWLQPFSSTSIWNSAIGSGASFVPAGIFMGFNYSHGCALRVSAANRRVSCKSPGTSGDTPEAQCIAAGCCYVGTPRPQCFIPAGGIPDAGIHADQDLLVRGSVGDPLTPFRDRAWSGGAECQEGGPQRGALPFPHDYVVDCEDNNNAFALLLGDNVTLLQSQPLYRAGPGADIMAQWPPSCPYPFIAGWNQSILGDGALGGHGGSFLSSIGGTLRAGELTRGLIPHALKVELFGHDFYWSSLFGPPACFTWPAIACDGYGNHSGWNGYAGLVPSVRPGALLAIPSVLEQQLLTRMVTPPARTILHALVTYGAYIVDDTAGDSVAICAEPAAIVELNDVFGISINITRPALPHSPGATGAFFADIVLLFQHLSAVVNNAPGSIGGGGTPLAPPAAPICE